MVVAAPKKNVVVEATSQAEHPIKVVLEVAEEEVLPVEVDLTNQSRNRQEVKLQQNRRCSHPRPSSSLTRCSEEVPNSQSKKASANRKMI